MSFLFLHKKSVKLVPLSSVVVEPSPSSCCRVKIVNPLEVLSFTQIEKVLSCFIRWGLHSLGYTNVSPFAVPAHMGIVISADDNRSPLRDSCNFVLQTVPELFNSPFPFDHNGCNAATSSNSHTRTVVVLSSKLFVWPSSIHALRTGPRRIFPLLWEWTNTVCSLACPNQITLFSVQTSGTKTIYQFLFFTCSITRLMMVPFRSLVEIPWRFKVANLIAFWGIEVSWVGLSFDLLFSCVLFFLRSFLTYLRLRCVFVGSSLSLFDSAFNTFCKFKTTSLVFPTLGFLSSKRGWISGVSNHGTRCTWWCWFWRPSCTSRILLGSDSLRCLQLAYAADSGMLDYLSRNPKNWIGILCHSVFVVSADSERPRPIKVVEVSRLVGPLSLRRSWAVVGAPFSGWSYSFATTLLRSACAARRQNTWQLLVIIEDVAFVVKKCYRCFRRSQNLQVVWLGWDSTVFSFE